MAYPAQKSQYDFSLFEMKMPTAANISTAPKNKPEQKKPQMKVIVNNKGKKKMVRAAAPSVERRTAKAGAVLLAFLLLCGVSISQHVKLDEINRQISRDQQTLTETKAQTVSLQMQLNSIVSVDKVEDYAVNTLGMVKLGTGQVEYIDMSEGDKVEVSGDKETKSDKSSTLKFLKFWEYLG